MVFAQVIQQVVILFVIMYLGYLLRQLKIINEEGIKNFSSLIFYVTMPALIISSLGDSQLSKISDIYDIVLASLITYSFLIAMTFIVPKLLKAPDGSVGLFKFMVIFGNVGFIGFPIVASLIGNEALFMAAIFNIPFNVFLYTIGVYFIVSDRNKSHKMQLSYKQFFNPGILATLLGILCFVTGIKIPDLVLNITKALGDITTPLAMLVVGCSLYGVALKAIYKNYRIFLLSLTRMLLFPLVIGGVLTTIGFSGINLWIPIILSGMPIGTTTVILARQYDGNTLEASEAVFISTSLMIVTIPILILIVQMYS